MGKVGSDIGAAAPPSARCDQVSAQDCVDASLNYKTRVIENHLLANFDRVDQDRNGSLSYLEILQAGQRPDLPEEQRKALNLAARNFDTFASMSAEAVPKAITRTNIIDFGEAVDPYGSFNKSWCTTELGNIAGGAKNGLGVGAVATVGAILVGTGPIAALLLPAGALAGAVVGSRLCDEHTRVGDLIDSSKLRDQVLRW